RFSRVNCSANCGRCWIAARHQGVTLASPGQCARHAALNASRKQCVELWSGVKPGKRLPQLPLWQVSSTTLLVFAAVTARAGIVAPDFQWHRWIQEVPAPVALHEG